MKRQPIVSVIIPTYNREKVLPNAINSVINQKYDNWELIIVDDRSTDNTKNLVNFYTKKDKRIKYFLNDRKKGPSGARNYGILNSNGEYIAFLDSDDEWLNHHLSDSIAVLENEKVKVSFALWIEKRSGNQIKFDEQEDIKTKLEKATALLKPKIKNNLIFFGDGFYEFTITENFYIYHINTMVFKKSILDKVGLLDERLFANEDNDFTYRVFHDYDFCLIKDYHFIYNEGQDNLYLFIDRSTANIENIAEDINLINKLTFNGNLENEMRKIRKKYVKNSEKLKDKEKCIKFINKSIAAKYFTLGYINRKKNKLIALRYYIKSIPYNFNKLTLIYIVKLVFPLWFKNMKVNPAYFDIG